MSLRAVSLSVIVVFSVHPALAEHWNVDYAKSQLGFKVQWSGEPFSATFRTWQADIDFDPADLAHSHASAAVDLASEFSDQPEFDSGLRGPEGFATTRFPAAHFVVSSFTHTGASAYTAEGTLLLHGISHKVQLLFTLAIGGRSAHMTGTAHVKRTDFELGQGEWSAPDPVAYDVAITVDVHATR